MPSSDEGNLGKAPKLVDKRHGRFRVILVRDGVCSSSDEGHDALLQLYHRRFREQIETASAEEILAIWV